jgi:DNA-binding LacI/PurR family transcriptional regulator
VLDPFQPIYVSIKNAFRTRILDGELVPGDKIPSELKLAKDLSVSRAQVRQALRDLEQEGYLMRAPGRGSFVGPRQGWPILDGGATDPKVVVALPVEWRHYQRQIVEGFVEEANRAGLHPMFYYLAYARESELAFLRKAPRSGVLGLAIWPTDHSEEERRVVRELYETAFPCVLLDSRLDGLETDFVGTDNRAVFEALTAALIAQGHTRLAYLGSGAPGPVVGERGQGFLDALDAAGLECPEDWTPNIDGAEAERDAALSEIATAPEPPTAFVCCHEGVARLASHSLGRQGMRLPGDFAGAALDDDRIPGKALGPDWLVCEQQGREIGRHTARLLKARIENPRKPSEQLLLGARFVEETVREGGAEREPRETAAERRGFS